MIVTALILLGLGFWLGYERGHIDGDEQGYSDGLNHGRLLRISDTFTPEQIEIQEGL